MSKAVCRFLSFALASFIALTLSFGLSASQALAAQDSLTASGLASGSAIQTQASKIYPSKKAAKKAVIAKVKTKWKKSKPKVKVKDASKKKNMTADQKKAYKKYKKKVGKKYKFYLVTRTAPRFTVSAKYKEGNGTVKTYSFKAFAKNNVRPDSGNYTYVYHSTKGFTAIVVGEGGNWGKKSWELFAVRKGSGTHEFHASNYEAHEKLTGKKYKSDFDDRYDELESAKAYFKMKG